MNPTPIQGYSTPTGGGFTLPPAVTVTAKPFTPDPISTYKAPDPIKLPDTPPTPPPTETKPLDSVIATSKKSSMLDSNAMIDVTKATVDNTDRTKNYNDSIALIDKQIADLETRRAAEAKTIDTNFGIAKDKLETGQKSETGSYSATLARMGGYLGNTASATGAMISLNQQHKAELGDLEAKRQQALQIANNAITDKQMTLAREKMAEIKDYTAAIEASKQNFFNNNKKMIEDQIQSQKDASIAEIYAGGTTDVASILTALKSNGLSVTANDVEKVIASIIPPAVNDLMKSLNQHGAPADVKLKVLNAKNANEAYQAAGPWAGLGGTGITAEYNYYRADALAKGLTPVDYQTFQTMDANRKAGLTTSYSGGSAYTATGASGEYGAYQLMPDTWKEYAREILGNPNAEMTPANQDAVATGMVAKWLTAGKTPEQIARKWNSGDFDKGGSGVNSKGVKWDIDAYVSKFKQNLKSIGGGTDAISVARAIKLTETGKSGDIPVERATNIILGSTKLTAQQKNDFTNAVYNTSSVEDAFTILKNKSREAITSPNASKLEAAEKSSKAFSSMAQAFKDYYDAGGDTGIISGTFQDVQSKLAKVSGDPKLVYLAVGVETAMQSYRNAISGTAYSVQEGNDILSIFPGIKNTETLNDAIIKARTDYFDKDIDAAYETVLGDAYKELKDEVSKTKKTSDTINDEEVIAKKKVDAVVAALDKQTQDTVLNLFDKNYTNAQVLEYLKAKGKI